MPIFPRLLKQLAACVLLVATASGCTTATEQIAKRETPPRPYSRLFNASYEEVEIALKQAMLRYSHKVDNTEAGIFETDFVRGDARFIAPHKTEKYPPGYRYRLIVRLVRGRKGSKETIKVQITKRPEIQRDFFTTPQETTTDGFEEQMILYRIYRELILNRAVARATEKANKKNMEEELP
ncbi:MAG TPA: hypothetical protein PLZ57_10955 [Pseudobdellovibrionaceae bacterium]|nr:hypothetical protein [Pseudobdellovibrionaceae bacterium]